MAPVRAAAAVATTALALLLRHAAATAAALTARSGHPVESVIELLQGLGEKAKEEGRTEEVLYTKFEHWCATSKRTLEAAMTTEKETLEELGDAIASHEKSISVLTAEISALKQDIMEIDAKDGEASAERRSGASLHTEMKTAHTATIDAIDQAIEALSESKAETATLLVSRQRVGQVLALLGAGASADQRALLANFAASSDGYEPKARPELSAAGDREGHVKKYSFKSDSVIELLKGLRLKFQDELVQMNKEETAAINAHDLASGSRAQLRGAKSDAQAAKTTILGETNSSLIQAQSDLDSTQGDLNADTESLASTEKACSVKKSEWLERSEIRANEIKAIEAAIAILAKVTGVRTAPPANPTLPTSPVSFLQLADPKVQKAVELLRREARLSHSAAMEQLAQELVAKEQGPFDQVINSIEKMVFQLQNEQKEEDDHKNWCDLELSKTNISIIDKEDKLDELSVKIENHDATAAALADDIRAADDMVAALIAHVEEATEIRNIGREENAQAVKDAQDAQTALANAISVLKDFYKSSGGMEKAAWEFLQSGRAPVDLPDTPSTWDTGYTSVADPAAQPGGIVAVLEKVSADFARMESDTKAQEASDQEAYDEDMKSCQIEKARRTKESEMKAQERKRVLEKQRTLEAEHKSVAGEHEATVQYMKDLQPACVEGSSSYEARKAARSGEIEALHEAQTILRGAFEDHASSAPVTAPDSFLQQRRLRGDRTIRRVA